MDKTVWRGMRGHLNLVWILIKISAIGKYVLKVILKALAVKDMTPRLSESSAAGVHTQPVFRARAPHICLNQSPHSACWHSCVWHTASQAPHPGLCRLGILMIEQVPLCSNPRVHLDLYRWGLPTCLTRTSAEGLWGF